MLKALNRLMNLVLIVPVSQNKKTIGTHPKTLQGVKKKDRKFFIKNLIYFESLTFGFFNG